MPKHALEMNSHEQIVATAGFIPLKDRIKMMQEAGKRLVEYRAMAYPGTIGDEEVDTSIFGKRYYDKIDLAELEKKHHEKLSEMQAYKAPKKTKKDLTTPPGSSLATDAATSEAQNTASQNSEA